MERAREKDLKVVLAKEGNGESLQLKKLEVYLFRIFLAGVEPEPKDPYEIEMIAIAKLKEREVGIARREYIYHSKPSSLRDWGSNEGAMIREAVETGYGLLATEIIRDFGSGEIVKKP